MAAPVIKAVLHCVMITSFTALSACKEEGIPKTVPATIGGKSFTLEVAADDESRRKGMMGRTSVAEDGGMVFAFRRPEQQAFWMKHCLIALDILFLDASGHIVQMHTMPAPPPGTPDSELPSYPSRWPAQFAIELKAGTSEKLGLKEGQKVELPLELLKQVAR
jgi:hypothetical protein